MNFGYVKCASATPNVKVADVNENVKEIEKCILTATNNGAELIVFPELCITGATISDLVFSNVLLENALNGLKEIVKFSKEIESLIFVGLPYCYNGQIYNVSACVCKGKVLGLIPKTNLKNYAEGKEKRYFSTPLEENITINLFGEEVIFGTNIIFQHKNNKNLKVAVELGEDLFSVIPPSKIHAINGVTVIVNLNACGEKVGDIKTRNNLVSATSFSGVCAYVLASAGDGESSTDVVFSGHNIIAENGKILKESKPFENEITFADIDVDFINYERTKVFNQNYAKENYEIIEFETLNSNAKLQRNYEKTPFVPTESQELCNRAELILQMQAKGLKKRIEHTNCKTVVLGLSGGLDSTLALLVAVNAIKMLNRPTTDILAVTMPCFGTTSRTLQNSIKLASALKVNLKKIDISKSVTRHLKDIKHKEGTLDVTFENAQARERTQVLMDLANMYNGMVVGTGDLSELALGWATYNGDHMSMYGVNSSIPKTLVRHLVTHYAINSKGKLKAVLLDILDTPVSPELLPAENDNIAQKTEDIVGPYILHDFYLYHFVRSGFSPAKIYEIALKTFTEFNKETILKWLKTFVRRFFNQQFKRTCLPDGVKIGSVGLSPRGDFNMLTLLC